MLSGAQGAEEAAMAESYDVVVIGAGPAGLTAGIYAARARLRTLILDSSLPGGLLMNPLKVSSPPGFTEDVKGAELARLFAHQAERFGARIARAVEVTSLDLISSPKSLVLDDEETVFAPAVIVATGARARTLGVEGEGRFTGRGISYCATCDGTFFEGKDLHVIGGGNSALEESLFLSQFARSVTLVHQSDHFQAEPASVHEALEDPRITVVWNSEPRAFLGENVLERLRVENVKTHAVTELKTDGVFVFIGKVPQSELLAGVVPRDRWGYVETDDAMATSVPGLFVAGDVRAKRFRQITSAVADGAIAALSAQKFLREQRARPAEQLRTHG